MAPKVDIVHSLNTLQSSQRASVPPPAARSKALAATTSFRAGLDDKRVECTHPVPARFKDSVSATHKQTRTGSSRLVIATLRRERSVLWER